MVEVETLVTPVTVFRVRMTFPTYSAVQCTTAKLFHTESLIGLVGPHPRLFLILNKLPLVISVLKEIVSIALLQNES